MIKNFKCKEKEGIWNGKASRKLPNDIQNRALNKLNQLNASVSLDDLKIPPSNNLEKLGGDRKGQMSIRINNQWRICFRWLENKAHDVEIIDYH